MSQRTRTAQALQNAAASMALHSERFDRALHSLNHGDYRDRVLSIERQSYLDAKKDADELLKQPELNIDDGQPEDAS